MAVYARCVICRSRVEGTRPCADPIGHEKAKAFRWVARVQFSRDDAPMEKSFLLKTLATKQEGQWRTDHDRGTLVTKKDGHTFGEALLRYKTEHVLKNNHNPGRSTLYVLEYLLVALGSHSLSGITLKTLKDVRDKLLVDRKWTGSTANRHFKHNVHAILEKAREWSWLDKNPAEFLDKLPEKPTHPRFLAEQEIVQLWKHIHSPVLHMYALAILRTGARPSSIEACSFDNGDVDLTNRVIWYTTYKHNDGTPYRYAVPIPADLFTLILKRYEETGGKGKVFVTTNITRLARQAIKASGVNVGKRADQKFTIYGLKHCLVSHAIMNGASESDIAKILGHTDTKMIRKHYAHLTMDHLRKAQSMWTMNIQQPIKLEAI